MLKLADKNIKTTLTALEMYKYLNKAIEDMDKKTQVELLEMVITMWRIKNELKGFAAD